MKAPPSPRVARPVMYHRWSSMTFLHWRYPAETVRPLVPGHLTVETFDGSAWVGMTPFLMEDVRAPGLPRLPWVSRFPETNLRTYVRDEHGRGGIWFLSLDAGRLPAVLGGRAGYWLPYHWSDMSVRVDAGRWRYRCRRIWPGPRGARCHAESKVGLVLSERERDETAHFLTARFRLFSQVAGRPVTAEVEHPPWPLHRAGLLDLDETLRRAAGLPDTDDEPLVHASPGVPVRIGMWKPL
ncbi:DUF2071 domain-containing protein [Nonomuraea sp. NPDC049486]|uniref:YqjF family protein n=1 Tax=Nonomuraea sp. NPDC049486 TaxID=3155773 RepID=UPI0034381071